MTKGQGPLRQDPQSVLDAPRVGDREDVILGSRLITFEELKSHEVPAVQFWLVIMLLSPSELANVLRKYAQHYCYE